MAEKRENAPMPRPTTSAKTGLGDAIARALALFSVLLNFTLPFGIALAGPVDENSTALCLSGYGARSGTMPFAPDGDGDGGGLATDDTCLLCVTCHTPPLAGSGDSTLDRHDPVEREILFVSTAIETQPRRGGEGAMRVRAPPAML